MPCLQTIRAYRSHKKKTKNNKSVIVFKAKDAGKTFDEIEIPCGRCIGCRIEKSKIWSLRCVHEASLFENNCFITLTFAEESINEYGTLVKKDFQKFMKRLRKKFKGIEKVKDKNGKETYPIRFFHCGEYGSELNRPHHHACLFNFDFLDKKLWSIRQGVRLYRSKELEKLWPFGYSTVGDVTIKSAAYVARYISKKVNVPPVGNKYYEKFKNWYKRVNKETGEIFELLPEYASMSRRPGIGKRWFERFKNEAYNKDFVTVGGKKFKIPSYYDKLFEEIEPDQLEVIKRLRRHNSLKHKENNTQKRCRVRQRCLESKVKVLKRGFEND